MIKCNNVEHLLLKTDGTVWCQHCYDELLVKVDRQCRWQHNSEYDDEGYDTACLDSFYITGGTAEENGLIYCPFCGGKIIYD